MLVAAEGPPDKRAGAPTSFRILIELPLLNDPILCG